MKKAIKLVNPGGTIIYSTCSILKEENEGVLEKIKDFAKIVSIDNIEDRNIRFIKNENGTLTICPNEFYEGFFIAKLIKN